jgi:hypothetical protein
VLGTPFAVTGGNRDATTACAANQIILAGGFTVAGGSVTQSESERVQTDATNRTWSFTWSKVGTGSNPVVTPFAVCMVL